MPHPFAFVLAPTRSGSPGGRIHFRTTALRPCPIHNCPGFWTVRSLISTPHESRKQCAAGLSPLALSLLLLLAVDEGLELLKVNLTVVVGVRHADQMLDLLVARVGHRERERRAQLRPGDRARAVRVDLVKLL